MPKRQSYGRDEITNRSGKKINYRMSTGRAFTTKTVTHKVSSRGRTATTTKKSKPRGWYFGARGKGMYVYGK